MRKVRTYLSSRLLIAVGSMLLYIVVCCNLSQAVTISTTPIGNPGNVADPLTGRGSVNSVYRMGKYEVTNSQYAQFLNGVDPTGINPLGLYSDFMSSSARGGIDFNTSAAPGVKYHIKAGHGNQPVTFVSWYDAIRFANWLHNGRGNGDTETGAYTLGVLFPAGNPVNTFIPRDSGARWWLPSENEWYKAAFHKNDGVSGNYWLYPTSSNALPASDQPPGMDAPNPANTANFFAVDRPVNAYNDGYAVTGSTTFDDNQNYLTNVGSYTFASSPYGTFDQAGNVWEWNEASDLSSRGLSGGSWGYSGTNGLRSSDRNFESPISEYNNVGFRVATIVPEPSALGLTSLLGLLGLGRRGLASRKPLRFERLEDRRLLAITVDTSIDEADGSIVDGDISLRDAIAVAAPGETIDFSVTGTITLTLGELLINKNLTISGPGADLLTIDASGNDASPNPGDGSRIFNIDDGTAAKLTVEVSGLRLTGGDVGVGIGYGGGAILNLESLTLHDVRVDANSAAYKGGGIDNRSVLTVEFSQITGNRSSGTHVSHGGGIHSDGILSISDSEIRDNRSVGFTHTADGGGIDNRGPLTITRSTISGNVADLRGGGIVHAVGDAFISDSTISDNRVDNTEDDGLGGGISAGGYTTDQLVVTNCTIADNVATSLGGGIDSSMRTTIVRSTISGNQVTSAGRTGRAGLGGGIHFFSGDSGTGYEDASLSVIDSTISGNTALKGGGLWVFSSYFAEYIDEVPVLRSGLVVNSTISGNKASVQGGGIFNTGTLQILHSTVTNNEAPAGQGGGIWSEPEFAGSPELGTMLRSSIVSGNIGSDVAGTPFLFRSYGHNLIGNGSAATAFNEPGDQAGILNPMLGPLQDNDGPTFTHALLPDSPAIDAGDPTAEAGVNGVPLYDQRGVGFDRVRDGDAAEDIAIDIGAFEVQSFAQPPLGDFDGDGDVDGRDFLKWQRGESPVPLSSGDFAQWQEGYGGEGSGVGGQGADEIAEFGLLDAESEGISDWRAVNVSNRSTPGANADGSPYEDYYIEQVDRAVEQWQPSDSLLGKPAVVPFGEMVVRRALRSSRADR